MDPRFEHRKQLSSASRLTPSGSGVLGKLFILWSCSVRTKVDRGQILSPKLFAIKLLHNAPSPSIPCQAPLVPMQPPTAYETVPTNPADFRRFLHLHQESISSFKAVMTVSPTVVMARICKKEWKACDANTGFKLRGSSQGSRSASV